MLDQYQREIDYIRISVTDRCNFRCRYYMPKEGIPSVGHGEILTYEELLRLLGIAAGLGICKVKITGGEPFVRKGICGFIREVCRIPGIESVTVTTNGALLTQYLPQLQRAGVSGINISLDTLDPGRFAQITGQDCFADVWDGLKQAVETGIPVKINCVSQRDGKEQELTDLAALAKRWPVAVRFIEMMPVGQGAEYGAVTQDEIRTILRQAYGEMQPVRGLSESESVRRLCGNGPAQYYTLPDFAGAIGFISAISHKFCDTCNRVRLTADGILKPCLAYEGHVNLKQRMREGATDRELEQLLRESIYAKPRCHEFDGAQTEAGRETRRMAEIGG